MTWNWRVWLLVASITAAVAILLGCDRPAPTRAPVPAHSPVPAGAPGQPCERPGQRAATPDGRLVECTPNRRWRVL